MSTQQYTIRTYITSDGRRPFKEWIESIDDVTTRQRIDARVARFKDGNLGDHKALKDASGLYEARLPFGPGYRIYFAREARTIILLISGGDKDSQKRDIRRAKEYYDQYRQERR